MKSLLPASARNALCNLLIAVASIAVAMTALPASAQETFSLKMQSSEPAGSPLYKIKADWAERLTQATNGRLKAEMHPVGSIVAYNETHEAIGAGAGLDGHVSSTEYIAGWDPAFALIGNPVGAYSSPYQMLRYIDYGGGKELMNELLNPYGIQFIGAVSNGLEAFTSKIPMEGVADLDGLKMRAPEGLVQKTFASFGASPVNMPASEAYSSMDKGVIDAADYTIFSTNYAIGLYDLAKYAVYPGFHSLPLLEVSINKNLWDSMPADLQAILDMSVDNLAHDMVSRGFLDDLEAVAKARDEGVTIYNWSEEERAKFRAAARRFWEEAAAASPNAQKVYDSLTAYLTSQGLLR